MAIAEEQPHAFAATASLQNADDDDLLLSFHGGNTAALGALYERHRADATRYAARLVRGHSGEDADDVVAEAIRKLISATDRGLGPRTGFRQYLFTAIRTVAQRAVQGRAASDEPGVDGLAPGPDEGLDGMVAMAAFASLPQHLRTVLWATKVFGFTPMEVASLLGIRANTVAVTALRAREALRVAYVRLHLPATNNRWCDAAMHLLARRTTASISLGQHEDLAAHLATCDACRIAVDLIDGEIDVWTRNVGWEAVAAAVSPQGIAPMSPDENIA